MTSSKHNEREPFTLLGINTAISPSPDIEVIPILQNQAPDPNPEKQAASKFINCELSSPLIFSRILPTSGKID
ncbi:hypothetical protein ACE1AT_00365 [Pelatocladus sp. BLCC-F211]|uniref:hypothetical protein n=1 Tax=Pelatocladus sp. BLCC-F211 TaxID=3342752 RepID=UPI0035B8519A